MKMIHVLSWLFVVIGGLHFALSGIGINLIGNVFGGHVTAIHIVIGIAILYHGIPALKAKLSAL